MKRVVAVPAQRQVRPPAAPRLPTTRPRGNGTLDPVLVRDGLTRLGRVLGH